MALRMVVMVATVAVMPSVTALILVVITVSATVAVMPSVTALILVVITMALRMVVMVAMPASNAHIASVATVPHAVGVGGVVVPVPVVAAVAARGIAAVAAGRVVVALSLDRLEERVEVVAPAAAHQALLLSPIQCRLDSREVHVAVAEAPAAVTVGVDLHHGKLRSLLLESKCTKSTSDYHTESHRWRARYACLI